MSIQHHSIANSIIVSMGFQFKETISRLNANKRRILETCSEKFEASEILTMVVTSDLSENEKILLAFDLGRTLGDKEQLLDILVSRGIL